MTLRDILAWIFGKKPPVTPPNPPAPSTDYASALLSLHNAARAHSGLGPLVIAPKLTTAAQQHADAMAKYRDMTHDSLGDGDLETRVMILGYAWLALAENIAAGQTSPETVMASWMNDPPHRRDILGPYTQVGFGRAIDGLGRVYWTADLGAPS